MPLCHHVIPILLLAAAAGCSKPDPPLPPAGPMPAEIDAKVRAEVAKAIAEERATREADEQARNRVEQQFADSFAQFVDDQKRVEHLSLNESKPKMLKLDAAAQAFELRMIDKVTTASYDELYAIKLEILTSRVTEPEESPSFAFASCRETTGLASQFEFREAMRWAWFNLSSGGPRNADDISKLFLGFRATRASREKLGSLVTCLQEKRQPTVGEIKLYAKVFKGAKLPAHWHD